MTGWRAVYEPGPIRRTLGTIGEWLAWIWDGTRRVVECWMRWS